MNTLKEKLTSNTAIFWYRFIAWTFFSVIAPVLFINYKYHIFEQVSSLSLSGWGMLIGLIAFVFVFILLRYILHSKKYAFYKQVIKGCCYLLLPLGFVIYCLYISRNAIDNLINVLCFCMLSWLIAICVNPMPKRTYEQTKGETSDLINGILDLREKKNNNDNN